MTPHERSPEVSLNQARSPERGCVPRTLGERDPERCVTHRWRTLV